MAHPAHPYNELVQTFPDIGRMAAFVRQVGGPEVVEAILSGELAVKRVGQTVEISEAVNPLFDRHSRRIPPRGLVAKVCDEGRGFYLIQPKIDCSERLERPERHFPADTRFPSVAEFEDKSQALLGQIKADEQLANLLKGVHLPICLPRLVLADYGQTLDEVFLPAVASAYKEQFPERSFVNYRHGDLAGQVTVLPGTRHERLLARMADGPVVGVYCPNPLQGYSVLAQREQMATLPESFLLSGGLDTATAWVMYPDVLARDYKTTGYDCAAVQWRSSGSSLYFWAGDDRAEFGYGASLSAAYDDYSGGLLFLG